MYEINLHGLPAFRSSFLVFPVFSQFESTKLSSTRKVLDGKVRNFSPTKNSSFTVGSTGKGGRHASRLSVNSQNYQLQSTCCFSAVSFPLSFPCPILSLSLISFFLPCPVICNRGVA